MDNIGYGWFYRPVWLQPRPGWTGTVFGRIDDVVPPWIGAKPANTNQKEADVRSAESPQDNDMGAQEDDDNDED